MASLIDTSDLTLNEQEALTVSEAVFEQVYTKPALESAHQVMTGIQMKTQIPFYGLLGLVGKVTNGCTPNTSTEKVNLTEKYWDPALIDFRLPHCAADIAQLFKMWKRSRIAAKTWEDVDNAEMAFITDRGVDATMESILRISSFGDKLADNVTDGGSITNGVDPAFFTMINGLWQQILAASVVRYTISENAAATKVAQAALASDVALNTFRYLYNNIDSRAHVIPGMAFQVTRTLWNNWNDFLEDKSLVFTLQRAEEGSAKGFYRGYPIIVRDDWDRNISAYLDNGTTYLYPHRAILTPIANIPIGTSDDGSMKTLESFYDKVTKSWYFDAAFYIDAKLLEEYLIAVAY
jgi:hypothetical protein